MRHVQPTLSPAKDTAINAAAQIQTNTSLDKSAQLRSSWASHFVGTHQADMARVSTGQISTEIAPFGAIKQLGLDREGSRHGWEEHLDTKYICFGGVLQ